MSDLSAFFAKKNDKKKKNAVVKMDDVGHILERRAKKQEEHDREVDEEEKREKNEEDRPQGEDSEWDEYNDSKFRIDEVKGLKDMGAEAENQEEEHHDIAEQKEQHETRKWGQVDKKEEKDVQTAAEMAAYQKAQSKPSVFVPSALREQRARMDTNIDVTNLEMFPSLADASKMETAKKEDTKTGGGWVTSGSSDNRSAPRYGGAPPNTGRDRDSVMAALKHVTAPSTTSAPVPEKPREEPTKKAGTYVPPHLRNK